jgi:outer membrane protein insertion porin family
VDISNAPDDDPTIQEQEGTTLNSSLQFVVSRDTRDNVFEPTRGDRQLVDLTFGGLGGDVRYWRIIGEVAWFFPLPVLDLVFATRALAGYVTGWGGEDVPIYERFFLGGATTLRGQETRSVAPKDAAGNVIGGTSEILVSAELLIPVFARFRLAVFFDAGNVYGYGTSFDPTDLRYTLGAGVRFFSPFGPLRLDYGYNLNKKPGEKTGYINFTVGAPF